MSVLGTRGAPAAPAGLVRSGTAGSACHHLGDGISPHSGTLTPWAIYGTAGLALAYAGFRKGCGNRLRAAFVPLLGARRAASWQGKAIDLPAVFATVFGTATSLGLGALQVAEGLDFTAGVTASRATQLVIIADLSAAFVASAFSVRTGASSGCRR